jgi:hypothetical protein
MIVKKICGERDSPEGDAFGRTLDTVSDNEIK